MEQELPHIYTVSALTREVRDRLETYFSLVWVSGEVSNLRQPLSGHYYFTLKDAGAQLRAVLFKGSHQHLRFKPQEGSQFLCRGRLTVYEPRGEYQLVVDYLEPLGLGALAQAFEVLKTRLQDEGLFAPELKKPLPFLPRKIALVTSPTGAAVKDFLRLLRQRFPKVEVLIYPVKVQGAEAAGEIAAGPERPGRLSPGWRSSSWPGGAAPWKICGPLTKKWWPGPSTAAPLRWSRRWAMKWISPLPILSPISGLPPPAPRWSWWCRIRPNCNRRLARLGATLAGALARRRDMARQHLYLMARQLPDVRRSLVDLRLKVDDKAEVLVRRARRSVTQQDQALRLATSRLFLLSPRRTLAGARPRLAQAAQMLGQSCPGARPTSPAPGIRPEPVGRSSIPWPF